MDLKEKLKEAKAKRHEIVNQVNEIGDGIEKMKKQRQALLSEALRFDGEVRALEALIKEDEK